MWGRCWGGGYGLRTRIPPGWHSYDYFDAGWAAEYGYEDEYGCG